MKNSSKKNNKCPLCGQNIKGDLYDEDYVAVGHNLNYYLFYVYERGFCLLWYQGLSELDSILEDQANIGFALETSNIQEVLDYIKIENQKEREAYPEQYRDTNLNFKFYKGMRQRFLDGGNHK